MLALISLSSNGGGGFPCVMTLRLGLFFHSDGSSPPHHVPRKLRFPNRPSTLHLIRHHRMPLATCFATDTPHHGIGSRYVRIALAMSLTTNSEKNHVPIGEPLRAPRTPSFGGKAPVRKKSATWRPLHAYSCNSLRRRCARDFGERQ